MKLIAKWVLTHSHYGYKLGLDSKKKGAANMNNEEFNDENIGRIVVALDDSGNFEEALENTTERLGSLADFLWNQPDIFRQIVKSEIILSITYDAETVIDIDMHKIIPLVVKELTSEELDYEKALTKLDAYVMEGNNPYYEIRKFLHVFLTNILQFLLDLVEIADEEATEPFEDSSIFKDFINSLDDKDQPV